MGVIRCSSPLAPSQRSILRVLQIHNARPDPIRACVQGERTRKSARVAFDGAPTGIKRASCTRATLPLQGSEPA